MRLHLSAGLLWLGLSRVASGQDLLSRVFGSFDGEQFAGRLENTGDLDGDGFDELAVSRRAATGIPPPAEWTVLSTVTLAPRLQLTGPDLDHRSPRSCASATSTSTVFPTW